MKKSLAILLIGIYLITSSGCGVLLYPERQGQKQGRLDVGVMLLDGMGLFFFVVPGLMAFIIDFYQGTIYLPSSNFTNVDDIQNNSRAIKIDGPITKESIEQALFEATGQHIDIADRQVQMFDLKQKQALFSAQVANNQLIKNTVKL